MLLTADLFWLRFVCTSNQLEVKTCYKNIQYCVHWLTLGGKRKQAVIMGRQGILLMHRITKLSNANARFSATINGDDYVDFKDVMLIEQLTVLLTYFQIMLKI